MGEETRVTVRYQTFFSSDGPCVFIAFLAGFFLFSVFFILRRIGAYATTERLKIKLYFDLHCV